MVTKERLKELIKQEATIYYIFEDVVFNTKEIIPITLNDGASFDITTAFETKEDAEEYLEFDTTQKSETLLMCDWSVAKDKKCGYCADFWVDGSNYSMLISGDIIYIQEEYYNNEKWNKDILFKESLNRENYDKARRLCKKLFLGDSNE